MPIDSIGVDLKMSTVDMDPKTYSPMSGSDENMSSPPSVLTIASAGSCTPSAGSTPSSIPSAGSTPYQFVSQEESSVIKPLTPSDHHSVHLSTPDQPMTPEPSVTSDLPASALSSLSVPVCKKNLTVIDECSINPCTGGANLSEDVNERREDCPCIMCDSNQAPQITPVKCRKSEVMSSDDCKDISTKVKTPKVRENDKAKSDKCKSRKKNRQQNKKVHYHSELSQDPESTGIKIKITLSSSKHKSTPSPAIGPSCVQDGLSSLSMNPSCSVESKPLPNKKKSKGKCNGKRNSSAMSESYTSQPPSTPGSARKRIKKPKTIDNFHAWGPVQADVNGELQSPWGHRLPRHILKKIFLLATCSQGCIPFLLRMARVCRYWREVSIKPSLWHTIDLSTKLIKRRYITEKKLLWLVENRLSKVEDLNVSGWTEALSPLMLRRLSELCPNVRGLNLSHCYQLHGENIHTLLCDSTNLQRLDLSSIMGPHKPTPQCAVGQLTLSQFATSLNSQLTHLTVANNTLSNVPFILNSIAENCSRIQVLDFSCVETVGRVSMRINIELMQEGCPLLRVLRFANSLIRLTESPMSKQVSSPGFPELEELSVAIDDKVDSGINDSELERILKTSNKLRLLDVRGCHNITESSLVRIPPWDLEHLFIAGGTHFRVYSDRLELVIRKWQHSLSEMDLSWTNNAEAIDSALTALAEETNDKLRVLNLCGSSVSAAPVWKLLKNCIALQWLNLTSCRALPRGVKRLYENSFEIDKLKESVDAGKYDEPGPDN